jgi:hypothetical protein
MKKEIKKIKSQIQKEYKELASIRENEAVKLLEHFNDAFGSLVEEDPEIYFENNYDGFAVKKAMGNKDYPTEILTVRYKASNYDLEYPDQLGLNYYTTSTINDFELKRLALIGSAAKIILNGKSEILGDYARVKKSFNNDLRKHQDKIWNLDKERIALEKLQNELDKEKKLEKAFKEGVELESGSENGRRGQYMTLRGDRTAYNVTKIRLIDYVNPETKKSVNIEVTETQQSYNEGEYYDLESTTYKVNKVRLSNLMYYINNSK